MNKRIAASDAARVPTLLQRKVIVADDQEFNRLVLSRILARMGCEVLEAATGEQAVQAFAEQLQEAEEPPLCVLMDINMPEMDGLEASMRIRQLEAQAAEQPAGSEATVPCRGESDDATVPAAEPGGRAWAGRRVPIWAVSSCSEREQLSSPAFAHLSGGTPLLDGPPWKLAGIDAFMGKPVNPAQLAEKLAQLQAQLQQQRQQQQPGSRPSTGAAVAANTATEAAHKRGRSRGGTPGPLSPTKRCRGGREQEDALDCCARELLGEAGGVEEETGGLVAPCTQ